MILVTSPRPIDGTPLGARHDSSLRDLCERGAVDPYCATSEVDSGCHVATRSTVREASDVHSDTPNVDQALCIGAELIQPDCQHVGAKATRQKYLHHQVAEASAGDEPGDGTRSRGPAGCLSCRPGSSFRPRCGKTRRGLTTPRCAARRARQVMVSLPHTRCGLKTVPVSAPRSEWVSVARTARPHMDADQLTVVSRHQFLRHGNANRPAATVGHTIRATCVATIATNRARSHRCLHVEPVTASCAASKR